jgi:hypothetical protein
VKTALHDRELDMAHVVCRQRAIERKRCVRIKGGRDPVEERVDLLLVVPALLDERELRHQDVVCGHGFCVAGSSCHGH